MWLNVRVSVCVSLTTLLVVFTDGFPSTRDGFVVGGRNGDTVYPKDAVSSSGADAGTLQTGTNWLTQYDRPRSSVIFSTSTTTSVSAKSVGKQGNTKSSRSSDRVLTSSGVPKPKPPLRQPFCANLSVHHKGLFTQLKRPPNGDIYKNKTQGTHHESTTVPSRTSRRPRGKGELPTTSPFPTEPTAAASSTRPSGALLSISNPRIRTRPKQQTGAPRHLDVCSNVWRQCRAAAMFAEAANPDLDLDELYMFFSTYVVPEAASASPTTPMTPQTEAVVAENCTLPPPYLDDGYDWLEVLASHGGLPGCVNSTQRPPPPQNLAQPANDTCKRPLPDNFAGEELYTYMSSDLTTFYRDEKAVLRFPGQPNQFVDIRGLLVWTSPPADGNVYLVEYAVDDSGLWIHIPPHTCKFASTVSLVCTSRLECWCVGSNTTCLAQHGLPGNLLATLVGGGR